MGVNNTIFTSIETSQICPSMNFYLSNDIPRIRTKFTSEIFKVTFNQIFNEI